MKPSVSAAGLLDESRAVLAEREKHYTSAGERNMRHIVDAFNAMTGHCLSTLDGWLFMVALKGVRCGRDPKPLRDGFVDGAGYFALAGEESLK